MYTLEMDETLCVVELFTKVLLVNASSSCWENTQARIFTNINWGATIINHSQIAVYFRVQCTPLVGTIWTIVQKIKLRFEMVCEIPITYDYIIQMLNPPSVSHYTLKLHRCGSKQLGNGCSSPHWNSRPIAQKIITEPIST